MQGSDARCDSTGLASIAANRIAAERWRSTVYMNLTADIMRAKVDLNMKMGNMFVNIFPDIRAWQVLNIELSTYLHRFAFYVDFSLYILCTVY